MKRSDSYFDYINALEVNPVSGHLFIATQVKFTDMMAPISQLKEKAGIFRLDRCCYCYHGRVYASLEGSGVWTSPTGNGSWTQIAQNGTPATWASTGRIVLAEAPSNTDIIYALYANGNSGKY